MSNSPIERCPRCGSPYMSAMLPTETPATRYCYTCATAAGSLKERLSLPVVNSDPNDLELQPLEETGTSSGSRGRIPQIAPVSRSGSKNPRPPTAVPNVRPSSTRASGIHNMSSASGSRNRISSVHSIDIPQIAPRASDFREIQTPGFPTKLFVGLVAGLTVVILAVIMLKGGKPTLPPSAPVASAAQPAPLPPKTVIAATPASASMQNKPVAAKTERTPVVKSVSDDEAAAAIGLAKRGPATPQAEAPSVAVGTLTPAAEAAKPEAKSPGNELNDLLAKSARKRSASVEEEDEGPTAPVVKAKIAAAPAEPKPVAATEAPDGAAAPAMADKDKDDDDIGGKPKKPRRSLIDNLAGDPTKPVKPEPEKPEKKENPFALKVIPVTSKEPTVMPLDLEKINGNERAMTEQLIAILPDWRVRDSSFTTNSQFGIEHQGRDRVIVLNPLNDVLPAKLIATVEIPRSFAGERPVLLFEVSSATNGKDWALGVRAMGTELLNPLPKIKLPKEAPWREVAIPLAPLAGYHFDLQIEVYPTAKHPKGAPTELGYIRNVRLEWVGKKKTNPEPAPVPVPVPVPQNGFGDPPPVPTPVPVPLPRAPRP